MTNGHIKKHGESIPQRSPGEGQFTRAECVGCQRQLDGEVMLRSVHALQGCSKRNIKLPQTCRYHIYTNYDHLKKKVTVKIIPINVKRATKTHQGHLQHIYFKAVCKKFVL